jgi:plasmid stabilization system protein ParE
MKRQLRLGQLAELKADIDRGLADVAEGRLIQFDARRIIAREEAISRPLNLRLAETAEIDLAEIWSYFAEEVSESFASDFLTRIESRFDQALRFPLSGAPRPHLEQHLRVLFYENYAVYYVPRADEMIIVRVLHASRDIISVADEGGFAI